MTSLTENLTRKTVISPVPRGNGIVGYVLARSGRLVGHLADIEIVA